MVWRAARSMLGVGVPHSLFCKARVYRQAPLVSWSCAIQCAVACWEVVSKRLLFFFFTRPLTSTLCIVKGSLPRGARCRVSDHFRQGRKKAALVVARSARPDQKARRVTAEMCRAILQRPDLTDEEADRLLDHLYLVADVGIDAFVEQRGRTKQNVECEPLTELGNEQLASVIYDA